jgi:hypothetical protein
MDFSNGTPQHAPGASSDVPRTNPAVQKRGSPSNNANKKDMWSRVGVVSAILAVVILLIGVIALVYSNNKTVKDTESSYIKTTKLQAVFLNTGQVYFGNISDLNNNYLVLNNIFYLQTNSSGTSTTTTSSNTNVTLVKLGCELHMPYDQMVINRAQVTFWENLQSNGQVAKAVASYDSAHKSGTQTCTDQSSSSSSTSSAVQGATTSTGTGTESTAGTGTSN